MLFMALLSSLLATYVIVGVRVALFMRDDPSVRDSPLGWAIVILGWPVLMMMGARSWIREWEREALHGEAR